MFREQTESGNLWLTFCKDYMNDQLLNIWTDIVDKIGLNFLSLRDADQAKHILSAPDWTRTIELMSIKGLSSSDAMILNMYQSSKFSAILSSDSDIGIAVCNLKQADKFCILPNSVAHFVGTIFK